MRSGDPAKVTATPRPCSASATASDGATCPAVPPAAIRHRTFRFCCSMPAGDVKEDPHSQEPDNEARAAVRDEWQRNPGQRSQAEDGCEIDHGLPADEPDDSGRETLAERIRACEGDPQARVGEGSIGRD